MTKQNDYEKQIQLLVERYRPVFESGVNPKELVEEATLGGECVIPTILLLRAYFKMPLADAKKMVYRVRADVLG